MATKTKNRNEIFDEKTTNQIASELQPVLSDLIALGLIVKQAHWSVTGSSFRAVHLQLDEIWTTVQTNVDEVAERISTLAVSPAGQANEVAASSKVDQIPAGFMDASKVVDLMTERVGQTCRNTRVHMDKIEDVDAATADLLHQIVLGLEKQLWMLRVQGM